MTDRPSISQMLSAILQGNRAVREIVQEPDGRIRYVLTDDNSESVTLDPLEQARAKRDANKGKARAHGH